MICTAHRLAVQCITLHFTKNEFPIHTIRNVQTHLKSTVPCTEVGPHFNCRHSTCYIAYFHKTLATDVHVCGIQTELLVQHFVGKLTRALSLVLSLGCLLTSQKFSRA